MITRVEGRKRDSRKQVESEVRMREICVFHLLLTQLYAGIVEWLHEKVA